MNKTLIFFKLRMQQLKSDKTALFFCYLLPVLLLLGIGYPLHKAGAPKITVYYTDHQTSSESSALLDYLRASDMVELKLAADLEGLPQDLLRKDSIKHFLEINTDEAGTVHYHLYGNEMATNRIENAALRDEIEGYFSRDKPQALKISQLSSDQYRSYVVTLLPGLIGMTFLIIGLNGFGGVIIEEEKRGLFKNLKTIDASPIPFLAGLFLSRLLIAYTVAIAMYLVGVLVFGVKPDINYFLLSLVVLVAAAAFLGLGLLIAVLSPSVNAFNGIVNFVQLPFIVLGGVFFSINTFPEWVQGMAQAIPMIHVNSALQQVLFENPAITSLGWEFAVVFAWAAATLAIGWYRFRW